MTGPQLVSTEAALRSEGFTLWALGNTTGDMMAAVPGVAPHLVGSVQSTRELRATVSKPVNNYGTQTLTIYAAKVPSP
jgi:hypothetical protein